MLRPIHENLCRQIYEDWRDYIVSNVYSKDVEFPWDMSIETSPHSVWCRPDLMWKDAKKILIIEGAVTHTSVLDLRTCDKYNKYQPLARVKR